MHWHGDVLKAAPTIHKFVDDLNNSIARKMEALLGSSNMKLGLDETGA